MWKPSSQSNQTMVPGDRVTSDVLCFGSGSCFLQALRAGPVWLGQPSGRLAGRTRPRRSAASQLNSPIPWRPCRRATATGRHTSPPRPAQHPATHPARPTAPHGSRPGAGPGRAPAEERRHHHQLTGPRAATSWEAVLPASPALLPSSHEST